MNEMRIVKKKEKQEKTNVQLVQEFNETINRQREIRDALISRSPIKVGNDIEFEDFYDVKRKGKVTHIKIEGFGWTKPYYSYSVTLYKKNGELGVRESYFIAKIE